MRRVDYLLDQRAFQRIDAPIVVPDFHAHRRGVLGKHCPCVGPRSIIVCQIGLVEEKRVAIRAVGIKGVACHMGLPRIQAGADGRSQYSQSSAPEGRHRQYLTVAQVNGQMPVILRRDDNAVTIWAVTNGFGITTLLGTP